MKFHHSLAILVSLLVLPLQAQKHHAAGDRVIRGNRLISAKSEPGQQLYQPPGESRRRYAIQPDAKMSEPEWKLAPVITPLKRADGAEDATSVRVLYDAESIHLFWTVHQPDGITTRMSEFDGVITGDDYVQVDLQPWLPEDIKHARDYYYTIAVNPAGQIWDSYFDPYLAGFFFSSWNSNATVATSQQDGQWHVEMTVPFASLDVSSDPGWRWQLRFHHGSKPDSGAAQVSSADVGITVRQDIQVRRPALVSYYWPRSEFMEEVKPNLRGVPEKRVRVTRLSALPAMNSREDTDLWQSVPQLGIESTDRMGTAISTNTARARVAVTDRHLCLNLEGDGAKTEAPGKSKEELGKGMSGQMVGVNGVFVDRALFENECFWIIVQPHQQGSDRIHDDYYMIIVDNRGGVRGVHYDRFGAPFRTWEPDAKVDLYDTDSGWGVEVVLDLRSLNVPPDYAESWGLNLFRNRLLALADDKSELQAWQFTGNHFLEPAYFGTLEQVKGLADSATRRMENIGDDDPQGIRDAASYYQSVPHPVKGGYALMDVQFIGRHGWAVGAMGTVLRTEDGGATWESVDLPTNADLYRVDFVNEHEGWIAGGRLRIADTNESMRHDMRGGYGYIFHTSDGGRTWECQYGERGRHIFGLDFVSETTGYAVGERGFLLKTEDGGRQWSVLPTTGTLNWLYGVTFRDEQTGFAVGLNEAVIKTTNGGRTWTKLPVSSDRKPYGFRPIYRDISFHGRTGCVVGQNGTVLISNDGGDTWAPAATVFKSEIRDLMDLRRVQFVTDRLGYAVGEFGTQIMVTEDGGASWSYRPVPNREWLRAVWADAQGKVVVTGERERVLISEDKGYSWRPTRGKPAKADVLVMMAHGDDAAINLSPFFAHYSINEDKTIVDLGVLSDVHSSEYEETYNLEHDRTMWMLGVRVATNFNEFETGNNGSDYYHYTERLWEGEENVIRHMVAAIRAYRPDVVITHGGVFGDYDKPGHKLSGRAGLVAFDRAGGDVDHYPDLTRLGLQPWQPKKLYHAASESYPMTLGLAPLGDMPLKGTNQTCLQYSEYTIRNFQSQGVYHARNGRLSLVKSLVPVPEAETSVFDGLQ